MIERKLVKLGMSEINPYGNNLRRNEQAVLDTILFHFLTRKRKENNHAENVHE